MKIVIERALLLKTLAHVQSVVERRNTLPILANILLKTDGAHIALTATDMDMDIVERVGCQVLSEGAATAPAHTLYEIVRKLPDGAQLEVNASDDQEKLTVRTGRTTFTLPTLPVAEFPALPLDSLDCEFSLAAAELKRSIDRTRFAISTEETRYYLNGIFFHTVNSKKEPLLRAVATDGHRLARYEMPLPEGASAMPGVILPRKAVNEVRKLLEESDQLVTVALSENRVRFLLGDIVLSSKLIDGAFPDYERVIPTTNDKLMEVDCAEFAKAVDLVSTISTEKSKAVKLTMDRNKLTLSAVSSEAGSAMDTLDVVYEFAPLEIGFNSRYLLDVMQQIDGGKAQFCLADSASPTVVRDGADDSAIYVLMPMRV